MRKKIYYFLFSIYFIFHNFFIYGNTFYASPPLLPVPNKLISLSNPTTNVIVELEDAPLLDHSLAKLDSQKFLSSTIYHALEQNLLSIQNDIQSQVLNDIDTNATFKYSYKNIFNGFSAEVASDSIEDIRNLKGFI